VKKEWWCVACRGVRVTTFDGACSECSKELRVFRDALREALRVRPIDGDPEWTPPRYRVYDWPFEERG
jgi:hypothetical protein